MALEKELETFKDRRQELAAEQEGKLVLIHGTEVVDVFTSYEDAIKAGYSRFGLSPFLVKQVHAFERTRFISRFLDPRAADGIS